MKQRILLTGGSSGIGKSCLEMLQDQFDVDCPSKKDFDLADIAQIDTWDYSKYDIVISSAGYNVGTYLGFHNNDSYTQAKQIQVNCIAPLLMAKHYTRCRSTGQFIYVSSASIDHPFTYNIFNATSKLALRYSMDILQKEFKNIHFNEVCPGKTKTNMLKQNYNGARTDIEIEREYANGPCLMPRQVAELVVYCIEHKNVSKININP
jgi:short-subunit dehydrogenase